MLDPHLVDWHEVFTEGVKYLLGAAVVMIRKACRDVNQAFKKMRSLELRVEELEKAARVRVQETPEGEKHAS